MTFSPDSLVKAISSHRQNILVTILVAATVLGLVFVPIAIWCPDPLIKYPLFIFLLLMFIFYMFWYSFFAVKDRDRLQSESHNENMAVIGSSNFSLSTQGHLLDSTSGLKNALDVGATKIQNPQESDN